MNVTFLKNDQEFKVTGEVGQTLFEVAQNNGVPMESGCNGNLACGQCHVIVDKEWFDKLPKATDRENDVLDFVFDLEEHSRLACQIKLTEDLDGIVVRIP